MPNQPEAMPFQQFRSSAHGEASPAQVEAWDGVHGLTPERAAGAELLTVFTEGRNRVELPRKGQR